MSKNADSIREAAISVAHRSARRAAVPLAALLAAATLGVAAPAHAAGLSATANCSSSGGGHFACIATVSGGTAPYAYAWTPIFNAAIEDGADGAAVIGFCDAGLKSVLSLTVTDATGASTTTTGALDCTGIAP